MFLQRGSSRPQAEPAPNQTGTGDREVARTGRLESLPYGSIPPLSQAALLSTWRRIGLFATGRECRADIPVCRFTGPPGPVSQQRGSSRLQDGHAPNQTGTGDREVADTGGQECPPYTLRYALLQGQSSGRSHRRAVTGFIVV